jgi:hypothetical protein
VKVVVENDPGMGAQGFVLAAVTERMDEDIAARGIGEDGQPLMMCW